MPGVSVPPRLMLTTLAPCATAHCIPAMTPESSPSPESSSTLPTRSRAPGATPAYFASVGDAAPEPAIVEATWVPWPARSTVSAAAEKFFTASIRSFRSGCVASTPESRTATLTPLPSYPAAWAAGAPICGTLLSRVAFTLPSSQIFLTFAEPVALVRVSHRADPSDLRARTASPLMLGRSRRTVAPAPRNVLADRDVPLS